MPQSACSDGTYLYTTFSGQYFQDCPTCPLIPIYTSENPIFLINSSQDTQCGVPRNSFTKYSPNQRCKIRFSSTYAPDGSGLGNYEATLNTCPLDGGELFLMGFLLLFLIKFWKVI